MINQVLVIKETSNENVLIEEKWKNVSDKSFFNRVIDFWSFTILQKATTLLMKLFYLKHLFLFFLNALLRGITLSEDLLYVRTISPRVLF